MNTFPSYRTSAGVVVEAGKVTGCSVPAWTVVANILHWYLTQAGGESYRTGTAERWSGRWGVNDVAGSAVLATLLSGVAGVAVLAVLSHVVRGAVAKSISSGVSFTGGSQVFAGIGIAACEPLGTSNQTKGRH